MDIVELRKLVKYIEENLRASSASGIEFVDARQHRDRLTSDQNHVVFGRRGAGKTSLVTATHRDGSRIDIYLNLEDFKDITFPNIIIQVARELFRKLLTELSKAYPWYSPSFEARRVKRDLKNAADRLESFLLEPDQELQQVTQTTSGTNKVNASVGVEVATVGTQTSAEISKTVSRNVPQDKLNRLRLDLASFKELILCVSTLLSNRSIFLFLDDLYFVRKEVQPDLIDFIHRLTKGTNLFVKLATIKHRSKLYRRRGDEIVGVELGHDIFEIDMDYTLDSFDELQSFMRELLARAISKSAASIEVEDLFAGDGFSQLCLASGGVPRDFLSLFVTLAGSLNASDESIGKVAVNEAAINKIGSKLDSMRSDSGDDDGTLRAVLQQIRTKIYHERRTNAFLVAKEVLENDPFARQAIRELVDLRLIHLLDDNTSKLPSDGRRYEAYILDIGLYENSRPRNFTQIEPGQSDEIGRKDKLRASPVFTIGEPDFDDSNQQQTKTKSVRKESIEPNSQLELSFE